MSTYIRYSERADTPSNSAAYYMFAMMTDRDDISPSFGDYAWTVTSDQAVDVEDIIDDCAQALVEYAGYDVDEAKMIAAELNPHDIIDCAEAWDDWDIVEIIYQHIIEPRGITAIVTYDGLLCFDADVVTRAPQYDR